MEQNKENFSDGKLNTYLTVKNSFGFEKYLDKIKNFEQRRTLTRFRISAHRNWQIQGTSPTRQNLHTTHG